VTGEPVAPNAFVILASSLVHLSSPKVVDEVKKDPEGMLAKAAAIRAKQPAPAPHVHGKAAATGKPAEAGK
jgi:hypothetical protein